MCWSIFFSSFHPQVVFVLWWAMFLGGCIDGLCFKKTWPVFYVCECLPCISICAVCTRCPWRRVLRWCVLSHVGPLEEQSVLWTITPGLCFLIRSTSRFAIGKLRPWTVLSPFLFIFWRVLLCKPCLAWNLPCGPVVLILWTALSYVGASEDHQKTRMFTLLFIRGAKLELWNSNANYFYGWGSS